MTLEGLLRAGRLSEHDAAGDEISRLLESAERALRDAGTDGLGADSRLGLAYQAIAQGAVAALLANGYRAATRDPAHHQLLIQSLLKTGGIPAGRVQFLEALRAARDRSESSGVPVSDAVAEEGIDAARELIASVRDWILLNRPDLVSAAA